MEKVIERRVNKNVYQNFKDFIGKINITQSQTRRRLKWKEEEVINW